MMQASDMIFDVKSGHRNSIAIGCGSPDKARGKSRTTARYAAFSIQATSFGGSDGMAYAMPVTLCVPPVFHTHSSCRPMWKWIGSCSKAQLGSSMSTNLHKTCKKCGGAEFYANRKCKACEKEYFAKRYAENTDKYLGMAKKWQQENPEKAKAARIKSRQNNAESLRASNAKSKAKNKDKTKSYNAIYYAANKSYYLEYAKQWDIDNPGVKAKGSREWKALNEDSCRLHSANRRAAISNSGGKLSRGLKGKLFKLQRGKCACCGQPLGDDYHLDHITPLALGGKNTDDNIQLLRKLCNLQKHAKDPIDFMQERGFLL